jgi:hypothetical protein
MAEISHERGQRFVVGYLRSGRDTFGSSGYTNARLTKAVEGFADEVIDVSLPQAPKAEPLKYQIHALDPHPNALANRIRAEILVERLRRHFQGGHGGA